MRSHPNVDDGVIGDGGRPNQYVGPRDQSHLGHALLDISRRSMNRLGHRDPRSRRLGFAAPAEFGVVDAIALHDVQPHQEGTSDGDLRPRLAAAVENAVVELLEIRIHAQCCVSGLAEHVPQQTIALLGDAAQVVFPGRGGNRRCQPDVAHDVFARGKARHGTQHQQAGQRP